MFVSESEEVWAKAGGHSDLPPRPQDGQKGQTLHQSRGLPKASSELTCQDVSTRFLGWQRVWGASGQRPGCGQLFLSQDCQGGARRSLRRPWWPLLAFRSPGRGCCQHAVKKGLQWCIPRHALFPANFSRIASGGD